jgi:chorismate dehydratase
VDAAKGGICGVIEKAVQDDGRGEGGFGDDEGVATGADEDEVGGGGGSGGGVHRGIIARGAGNVESGVVCRECGAGFGRGAACLESEMKKCRIACVRYLNTVPLIEGLEKVQGVELIPTVPSRIAGMVRSGEAEVGLCSVVDWAGSKSPNRQMAKSPNESEGGAGLVMLPVGMIGCDGPTLTVRVFSRVPMEKVREVHADTDSHTSVVLCRVVLERLYGVEARFVEFDARERVEVQSEQRTANSEHEGGERVRGGRGGWSDAGLDEAWPETVLLIGDKVVVDAPPEARYPYQLDLGEAWKRLTGLPFVYAVWMCRGDRVGEPTVVAAAAALDRQRRHNAMRLDWIVAKHAPEHRWPVELARKYLGEYLRFDVGKREREAVGRFFAEAGLGEAEWAGGTAAQRYISAAAHGA